MNENPQPLYESYKDVNYCSGLCPYLKINMPRGVTAKCLMFNEFLYYYDGFLASCQNRETNDLV